MMMQHFAVAVVISCSVIEGFAQVMLKKSTLPDARKSFWVALGMGFFVIEAALYTYALQWLDISIAYPLGALCFVVVTFLSRWLLHEVITPARWMGIGFILAGCALITL